MKKINVYENPGFIQAMKNAYHLAKNPVQFYTDKFVFLAKEGDKEVYMYNEPMDQYVITKGAALAAVHTVKLDNGLSCDLIVWHSALSKLPDTVKRFILSHEMGHSFNGDTTYLMNLSKKDASNLMVKRSFGYIPKMEFGADAFAAKHLGAQAVKDSMCFLLRNTNLPLNSKVELIRRIMKL